MEEKVVGSIQKGFLVLIGVGQGDDEATADKYMKKLLGLRIFEDENGKTNKSLADVDGQLLMVSQFTPVSYTHLLAHDRSSAAE